MSHETDVNEFRAHGSAGHEIVVGRPDTDGEVCFEILNESDNAVSYLDPQACKSLVEWLIDNGVL